MDPPPCVIVGKINWKGIVPQIFQFLRKKRQKELEEKDGENLFLQPDDIEDPFRIVGLDWSHDCIDDEDGKA